MNLIIDEKWLKNTAWLILCASLLYITGLFPEFVEKWYALGFYPLLANCLRFCLGWLPFSVGDTAYMVFLVWLGRPCLKGFKQLKKEGFTSLFVTLFLGKALRFFLLSYILFKSIWGLNYNRLGIAWQVDIEKSPYSKEAVTALTNKLIDSANYYRKILNSRNLPQPTLPNIYTSAIASYQSAKLQFPFLQYDKHAIKGSLFTPIADYIGFTGYYNPFSGEAQLRTDIPRVLVPFTTCHEIAHQLGYASESEASFVGFLAAKSSVDPYLKYSAYFEMLQYALGEQYLLYAKADNYADFSKIVQYNKSHIDTLVSRDKKMVHQFFMQHQKDISSISNNLYDQYLKMNQQLKGINSYNDVVGWIIAYDKMVDGRQ
jgi:hypothetical protein